MSREGQLGEPPAITLEVVDDHGASSGGFLRLRRLSLRHRYPDGRQSPVYTYEVVERVALDAVTLALWGRSAGVVHVCLRSQLRPPLALRDRYYVPMAAQGTGAVQWELPAGLVEPGERGVDGLRRRAAAEALEETGFRLEPTAFEPLGPATSLSPGMCAEKLHFLHAEVDLEAPREAPPGDGHPLEELAEVRFVPLDAALTAVERELVHDIKTEVGLRRLAQRLGAA